MSTLMCWKNRNGEHGRCDNKCHNATTTTCECMCGGHFHGSKRDGTYDAKLHRDAPRVIARAKELAAAQGLELKTADELLQPTLFPI